MLPESIAVTIIVIEALENLGVTYVIGGSMASGVHGVLRATMDADLVADLRMVHARPLAAALNDLFYADLDTMREAIRSRSSFNVIHLKTAFKVDIFVAGRRAFERAQLARRQLHLIHVEPPVTAYVSTAEDIILAKLDWYRLSGCVSDRQWRDVLGVIMTQGDELDTGYLREMAVTMGIARLLKRAVEEAGGSTESGRTQTGGSHIPG